MVEFQRQISKSGLAFSQAGSGPLLLLIHGVGLRAENWYQQLPAFSESYTTVCVDLPGHGHSSLQDMRCLQDYVNAITVFIDELLLENCQQELIACGHSLGALIVTELASQQSTKIRAGIALSPIHNRSAGALQAVQSRAAELKKRNAAIEVNLTLQRWFGDAPIAEHQEAYNHCRQWLAHNNKAGYAAAYQAFAQIQSIAAATLQSIQCPMLYCTGERDPNSTPAMSAALAAATPNARAQSIEGARHMLSLTHADILNLEIEKFLSQSLSTQTAAEAVSNV